VKIKLIAGGTTMAAAVVLAAVVGAATVPTTAALPAPSDYSVASGVSATVTQLEAEKAAAEAAAKAAAEAQAKAEAEAAAKAEAAKAAAAKASSAQGSSSSRPAASRPSGGATNDYGIADSAYTGPYFDPAYESTRKCIVRRESGGNYGIVSSNGMYYGAYQFSRSTGDATARSMGRGDLVGTPVNQWSRAEQDQAFWTLWNHGAGRGHWGTAPGC
jgi:hypothetical protein